MRNLILSILIFAQGVCGSFVNICQAETKSILNVSYDPTRELYEEINVLFKKHWKEKTGQDLEIKQSHGGSGKQARAVIDGLEADVVSLALAFDIDEIAKRGLINDPNWAKNFAYNSCPYTSTIVFLVRKGNPKAIKDWDDLTKPGVEIITPNPKTSGGARWNYLAAWGYAQRKFEGDEAKIKAFMKSVYKNVVVLDSGARAATNSFVQRGLGDVLIAWENEALLVLKDDSKNFTLVAPTVSILAEPPLAIVDTVVAKRSTNAIAKAYIEFLYSEPAQEIEAKHFYRPRLETVRAKYEKNFPTLELFTLEHDFKNWNEAHQKHFAEGASFDQIYEN